MKKQRLLSTFSFLLLLSLCFSFQQDVPARMHLFLLIGQSNMAGRGIPEADDKQPNPRVWMLTKEQTWVPAQDPMHFDKPKMIGVGPGLSFGKKLAQAYPAINIGLIPCAVGGSGIDVWKPGAYYEQTQSHPYDDAIRRARKALENGQLAGILWHQGETDSSPDKATAYGPKLVELAQRLRADLNAPNVPFIVGTLGDFVADRNADARIINATLEQAPMQIKNTYCVHSSGLMHKGDTLHFDAASARTLGQRYADVFIQNKLIKPIN